MSDGITALLNLLANWMGFTAKRQELNNSPEVQAAAKAKQEQAARDREAKAVKERDTDEVRRNISE